MTREWLDEHGRGGDLIVECTDNFDAKYLVADYCADSGVPLCKYGRVDGQSVTLVLAGPAPR